jgi:hypothetical protein
MGAALNRQIEAFLNQNNEIKENVIFNIYAVMKKIYFCSLKQVFLYFDFSGISNCINYSVVPSITNENCKNVLFYGEQFHQGILLQFLWPVL